MDQVWLGPAGAIPALAPEEPSGPVFGA
jgi:hypothetical protein